MIQALRWRHRKDFQERIQQALQAMGSMMAQNTLEPINEENVSNANMSLSPPALSAFDEAAMSLNEEDLFNEMSFDNQSGGSEIGDADLEALLSGESEEKSWGVLVMEVDGERNHRMMKIL